MFSSFVTIYIYINNILYTCSVNNKYQQLVKIDQSVLYNIQWFRLVCSEWNVRMELTFSNFKTVFVLMTCNNIEGES